jgi:O-antigen ligase
MKSKIERLFPVLFYLLLIGMPISMALIEFSSWSMLIFWLVYRALIFKESEFADLRIPGWSLLWVFFVVLTYGAFTASHFTWMQSLDVLGDARWIPLMLMYFDLFKRRLLKFDDVFRPLSISICVVFVFGIYQFFTGSDPFRDVEYLYSFQSREYFFWRVKGFYGTPMTFGNTMAMWFSFFATFLMLSPKGKKDRRLLLFGLLIFSGFGFLFSFVRGAWIGVFITGLFIGFVRSPLYLLASLVVFVGIALATYKSVPPIKQRVDATLSGKDTSIKDRIIIWDFYKELFMKYPVFGAGHRFTGELMEKENIISTGKQKFVLKEHAHSNFLQILAGLGLVGFLAFYGFFINLIFKTWSALKTRGLKTLEFTVLSSSISAIVCFHASSITEATILDWEVVHILALMLGLSFYCLGQIQEGPAENLTC